MLIPVTRSRMSYNLPDYATESRCTLMMVLIVRVMLSVTAHFSKLYRF